MSGMFGTVADLLEFGPPEDPVCRFHSVHCQMGRNWPLDRAVVDPADVQMDDLRDLVRVSPHPRDLWAVNRHERVPSEELAQKERELAEALAEAQARNDAMEAQIRGEAP